MFKRLSQGVTAQKFFKFSLPRFVKSHHNCSGVCVYIETHNRSSVVHSSLAFSRLSTFPQESLRQCIDLLCQQHVNEKMLRMTPQKSRDIVIQKLHCYSGVKQIMYETRIVVPTNTDIFHVPRLIFSYSFLNINMTMMTLHRTLLTRASQSKQHKGDTNKNMQRIFTTTPSDSKLSHELKAYA